MAGFTRRLSVVLGIAVLSMLLLPVVAAGAQTDQTDQYPPVEPTVVVGPANVTRGDVADPGDPAEVAANSLAFTGSSDTVPTILVAGGLVLFGGALVFVASRRRAASQRA